MLLHVKIDHYQGGVAHLVVISNRRQFEQVAQLKNRRNTTFAALKYPRFRLKIVLIGLILRPDQAVSKVVG